MNLGEKTEKIVPVLLTAPWVYGTNLYVELLQKYLHEEIRQVDIDSSPEIADKYNIVVLPTLIFLNSDTEIFRFTGFVNVETIMKSYKKIGKVS